MCGICGIISYLNSFDIAFNGIVSLLNRGYDSVGICTLNKDNSYMLHKYASTDNMTADKLVFKHKDEHNGSTSIAHSRWRTTGGKTDENAHPHNDSYNIFSLVHNGIIENYKELKKFLLDNGFTFRSETDSEVIVNLISYYYKLNNNSDQKDAIISAIEQLHGTYALVIICKDTPNRLYCIRHGSPLLIGYPDDYSFGMVASEKYGFDKRINNYFCIDNNDLIILEKSNNIIKIISYQKKIYNIKKMDLVINNNTPEPYIHWTLKEIMEQPECILRAIGNGGRILNDSCVKLGGLDNNIDELSKLDDIIILGCGTSYHAGMLGLHYFKDLCDFNTVQLFDGAEFTERDIPKYNRTGLIFISQSGETRDLYKCIKIGKDNNLIEIGVINVVDSLIARETNCGVYLNAGREVGVASTKAFISQSTVLALIAIWFSQIKGINEQKRMQYINDLRKLHIQIQNILDNNNYDEIINLFNDKNSCFILGKGRSEAIAYEGALKIKEISYIHAEGYSGSSLKHGPYSLLDTGFPVILINPKDDHYALMNSIHDEIIARNATVITITDKIDEINNEDKNKIIVPYNKTFASLLCNIPLQILAYRLAIKRNYNPDFPRHLCKTVTTD